MTFMPWTSTLELGITEIDDQHKELVRLTNALHEELGRPAPQRSVIGEVLEGLVDYTHNHFIVEEVLFQRHGYPETPAHQAQHDRFTAKAMDLLLRFEDGAEVSLEALDFLKDWLIDHICKVDRAYLPFFRAALGLEPQEALAA
ncbi:bacteriohemerythrin [Acidovorax sp. HDW3]|uniref:bacteriohemerythrin n=1 Tax=Acidovorax sp. HDW3 TaxID=2714923 RepID=UPI001408304E|nr:bacteriohemerythrin [Acidovorax sp. HDW3]QIL43043.1 bacteriohemerythrin [Acidovorax sp. HDW3]